MWLKCYSLLLVFPTTIFALMLSGPCPPERWSEVKVGALGYVPLYLLYNTFMTKHTEEQIPFFMDLSMTNYSHPLQLFATEEGSIDKTYLDPFKCQFRERLIPNAEHTSWDYEQIGHPKGSDCVSGYHQLTKTTTNWDHSGTLGVIYGCLDVNNGWQKDSHEVGIFVVLHRKNITERTSDMQVTMEMLHKIDPLLLSEMLHLGFSITFDNNMDHPNCDFVAPDEVTFNYWTDGINALLGQPMVSKQKEEDLKTLLAMEIKLRLLDTEGVDISKDPPPIPEEPDNYDFNFES